MAGFSWGLGTPQHYNANGSRKINTGRTLVDLRRLDWRTIDGWCDPIAIYSVMTVWFYSSKYYFFCCPLDNVQWPLTNVNNFWEYYYYRKSRSWIFCILSRKWISHTYALSKYTIKTAIFKPGRKMNQYELSVTSYFTSVMIKRITTGMRGVCSIAFHLHVQLNGNLDKSGVILFAELIN